MRPDHRPTTVGGRAGRNPTEVSAPVDSGTTPQTARKPQRRTKRYFVVGLVAAGSLLAACSSSSTPATTTTAPPGGKLTGDNASYIAADLKAPAGTLHGGRLHLRAALLHQGLLHLHVKNQGLQMNYSGVGSGDGITDFEAGTVDFAASDVPMPASDLAKVPASSGPVVQVPDTLGGVAVAYNLPGVVGQLRLDGRHPRRHLPGHHQDVERRADRGDQPGGDAAAQRHRPRGAGRQLGHHLHLHRLPRPPAARRHGLDPGGLQDHHVAVGGRADRRRTPGWPPASSPRRTPSATSSWATPSRTSSATPRSRTPPATSWCRPSPRWPPTPTRWPASPRPNFSIVNQAGRHQLPDRRLQLGHPAAEADQRHHRRGQVVKVLDWTTHTGGGQNLAAGLDYVPLPPDIQNQVRTALLTVTGPSGEKLLTK